MKRASLLFLMLFIVLTKLNAENLESLLAPSVAYKPILTEKQIRLEYTVQKINEKLNIDGVLDEISWRSAVKIPLKYETFPGNNTPAPVNTQCLVAFDETNLYFAFVATDPNPENIRAYITDRDNTQGQDRVAIYIDTFNDARRAFDFTVTAPASSLMASLIMNVAVPTNPGIRSGAQLGKSQKPALPLRLPFHLNHLASLQVMKCRPGAFMPLVIGRVAARLKFVQCHGIATMGVSYARQICSLVFRGFHRAKIWNSHLL